MAASGQDSSRSSLLRLVGEPHAKWVGDALLPQMGRQTPEALVLALTSRLSMFSSQALTEHGPIEVLQKAFQRAVTADFSESRCMSVSGWVLTRTEAELCALAALSASKA
jgi:uncharacterized membrane protein YhfC